MRYITTLIERPDDDENGQDLSNIIGAELTYLSKQGITDFILVPVQNAGRTVSVIIAGKGEMSDSKVGERPRVDQPR
jgi:hypothetical protein